MRAFLRFFFHLLYHPFASAYDLVAATVSLGRWKDWVLSVVPFIKGTRVLEIGHGPGHLQRALLGRDLIAVGIDESAPMGRLAKRNLRSGWGSQAALNAHFAKSSASQSIGYAQINLTRGLAQHLPFACGSFDSVVATFPADYIFETATLEEAHRVLVPGGRFVILPGASILGRGFMDRLMAFIFRITGETPPNLAEVLHKRSKEPFAKADFNVEFHELDIRSSRVFILVATKSKDRILYV